MLTTNDVGELFQAMRTAYGQQWKHGGDALEVWRRALGRFTPRQVLQAATDVLSVHVDFPPTLPQFLAVLDNRRPKPTTYLAPPKMSQATSAANRSLLRTIMKHGGIENSQLALCVKVKNAAIEDHGDRDPDREFVDALELSLDECANLQDRTVREVESEAGRQRYKRARGMQAWL